MISRNPSFHEFPVTYIDDESILIESISHIPLTYRLQVMITVYMLSTVKKLCTQRHEVVCVHKNRVRWSVDSDFTYDLLGV